MDRIIPSEKLFYALNDALPRTAFLLNLLPLVKSRGYSHFTSPRYLALAVGFARHHLYKNFHKHKGISPVRKKKFSFLNIFVRTNSTPVLKPWATLCLPRASICCPFRTFPFELIIIFFFYLFLPVFQSPVSLSLFLIPPYIYLNLQVSDKRLAKLLLKACYSLRSYFLLR